MKPSGGLVEDVERAAGGDLAELAGELDALRLAAGERGGRLAELDVAKADLVERLRRRAMRGTLAKKPTASSTLISSTSAMFLPCTRPRAFAVVALAVARLAGHVDVRQEVHLDLVWPSPRQASQRPPLTLKLKRPGL